ncbi:NAD(P)/FAD-dependent oxidoreductase [Streptomyces mirabilis]|uniref:NAD(P)/FAD-dependent oxidoreductase n=1 Tax=Streptomyces mirabilis TaxID=68239 RepID=UPI0033AC1CD2
MTSTAPGVLVVGAGQAGLQLACSLRDADYGERITLVGEEPHPPYQRPPLSKAYLKGDVDKDALMLRAAGFYADRRIELVAGDRAVAVTRDTDGSGEAVCASGRVLSFRVLVLATGARPRALGIDGAEAAGVHVLRTFEDADSLAGRLRTASDVAVIGGGFVGLEIAAAARGAGARVTVLEAAPRLLGRAVGPVTADRVLALHRASGIDVRLGAAPTRIVAGQGRAEAVELMDGSSVAAQLVVVGIGAVPNTELAESMGLSCDRGIVVDAFSRASDGTTLAIGDCAVVPDPTPAARSGARLRMESVDNAVQQAKAAAATILGERRPYAGMPWFWSDQGNLKLQIAGVREATDLAVARGFGDPTKLVVGHYRDDRLVAAEAVNAPADFMALRKALANGVDIAPSALADPGVPLKTLIQERAGNALTAG